MKSDCTYLKRMSICGLVGLGLVFSIAPAILASAAPPGRLIPATHVIFDYDVRDLDATEWLGLFQTDDGYALRPVTPSVAVVPYEPYEMEGDEPMGRVVTVANEGPQPRFLFAGLPALTAGPIVTLFDGSSGLPPGGLTLGQPDMLLGVLLAEGTPLGTQRDSYANYSLTLSRWEDGQQQRQVLVEAAETYYRVPWLFWAGDIDGDGKMDLIIDPQTNIEGSASLLQLYLSTMAAEGELVGLAAEIGYGGC